MTSEGAEPDKERATASSPRWWVTARDRRHGRSPRIELVGEPFDRNEAIGEHERERRPLPRAAEAQRRRGPPLPIAPSGPRIRNSKIRRR